MRLTRHCHRFFASLLSVCCLLLLYACFPRTPKTEKAQFLQNGFCFDNSTQELGKHIRLDGYYTTQEVYIVSGDTRYTTVNHYFLDNGMFMDYYRTEYNGSGLWGTYVLRDAVIQGKSIYSGWNGTTETSNVCFEIINDTTLRWLSSDCTALESQQDGTELRHFKSMVSYYSPARFVKHDRVPDVDNSWLKNRKWFWCNPEEFKEWKAGRKKAE